MRDELLDKITMLLMDRGVDTNDLKSQLYLILSEYEVTRRCTEVAVVNEDDITKYIRLFLVNKKVAGRTERTIGAYKSELRRFFMEAQKSPLEITADDIKIYLATKEVRDGAGKVYQKNISRVLSSFFAWMQKEEYIIRNPMNKVEEIKTPKKKKKAFTEIQIEQLRLTADGDDRIMCMIEILLSTWCRVSELCQMKKTDIAENMESVQVHGKGEKDRTCYLNARAKLMLKKYLDQRGDSNEYVFPECAIKVTGDRVFAKECREHKVKMKDWWTIPEMIGKGQIDKGSAESLIRKLGNKAGVEKTHPHRFRRTGATFALRRGMPIEQVSKLLGHESVDTTMIYLDISEKELEQAHKKYV